MMICSPNFEGGTARVGLVCSALKFDDVCSRLVAPYRWSIVGQEW